MKPTRRAYNTFWCCTGPGAEKGFKPRQDYRQVS